MASVRCTAALAFLMLAPWIPSPAAFAVSARQGDDGAELLKAKKYVEAEAVFRKVLEGSPDDTGALQGLAEALEGQGKPADAATVYERLANVLVKTTQTPVAPPPVAPAVQLPTPAPVQPASPGAPAVGEVLEVKDTLGTWYKSTVLKVDGQKRFIHYEGWSDTWDEWVTPDRVRPLSAPAAIVPAAGREVLEVRDAGGSWYKSTVLKVDGDKKFIHYEGWSDHWDEWVTPDRMRPLTAAASAPEKLTFPTKLGKPVVGEVLHAMDTHDKWTFATVYQVDGDKRLVHYRGRADGTNEWVGPDRVKALTSAEATAAAKKRTLDGWFVKTEITAFGGSRLKCTYYWFRSDGTVYFGPPVAADFAAVQKAEPKNCGTYTIVGEDLKLIRTGAAPEMHTYSPGAGGVMDSCPLQAVVRFKDGAKLDGTWGIDYSGTFGGVHSISSNTWVFHRDGTFEHTRVGGVETTAHTTGTGEAPGNAVGVEAPIEKGTYTLAGGKLSVKGTDGRTQAFSVWGVGSEASPSPLGIDGLELNRIQ